MHPIFPSGAATGDTSSPLTNLTRELWGRIGGMSVTFVNKQKVTQWLKTFPGALNDTGDIQVIKRSRIEGGV